jgi:hypothetical protein
MNEDPSDFNPNLGNVVSDVWEILDGLDSSSFNVATLLTIDAPAFLRRAIKNKIPITLIKALMDRLPEKDYHRSGDPQVFLRHGYLTGAASMRPFGKVLDPSWGINNHQYDYTDKLENLSVRFLDKVKKAKDSGKEVYLVSHSKGSLIGLLAYQKLPDHFDMIVTMAVPIYGSEMANKYSKRLFLPPIINLREFRTDNPTLRELRERGIPENAPILNLYSDIDEFIKPSANARLPDQENITNLIIPKIKHNEFLYDSLVHQVTRLFLHGMAIDRKFPGRLDYALKYRETARIEELVRVNGI